MNIPRRLVRNHRSNLVLKSYPQSFALGRLTSLVEFPLPETVICSPLQFRALVQDLLLS